MPQITLLPGTKGLVQETGSVVAGETIALSANQAVATSGHTILTAGRIIARCTVASGATAAILEAGTVDGQICIVINKDLSNTITFAAQGTSNVALGTVAVIGAGAAALCVWDSTTEHWHLTET